MLETKAPVRRKSPRAPRERLCWASLAAVRLQTGALADRWDRRRVMWMCDWLVLRSMCCWRSGAGRFRRAVDAVCRRLCRGDGGYVIGQRLPGGTALHRSETATEPGKQPPLHRNGAGWVPGRPSAGQLVVRRRRRTSVPTERRLLPRLGMVGLLDSPYVPCGDPGTDEHHPGHGEGVR